MIRRGRFHICPFPRPESTLTVSLYPEPISALYESVFTLFSDMGSMTADMESAPTIVPCKGCRYRVWSYQQGMNRERFDRMKL